MGNNIKIGYITTTLLPKDGWGRYSGSLVRSVSNILEVEVLVYKNNIDEKIKTYPVLPSPSFHPFTQLKVFFYCLKYLRKVNIIHSLVEPFAPGAALAALFLRIPFVVTLHGTYSVPPVKFSFKKIMMKYMYYLVTIATTGSLYTEKKVREIINFGECRFIPNGVDDNIFYKTKESIHGGYLLTVGGIKSRKGADLVIDALFLLKEQFPNLKYKIVGSFDDIKYMNLLKTKIEKYNLEDRVEFLDNISDDQLRFMYNSCNIFILAARDISGNFEGFPMVFYEANACGAPVITTSGFGSEYAIKNSINGYVVAQNNSEEIADAIKNILSNKDLHSSMKQNALIEAKKHTWDKVSKEIIEMYVDAMKIKYK